MSQRSWAATDGMTSASSGEKPSAVAEFGDQPKAYRDGPSCEPDKLPWAYDDGNAGPGPEIYDCVARAIAIATGRPYGEVYHMADEFCFGAGAWGVHLDGVPFEEVGKLMSELGWRYVPLHNASLITGQLPDEPRLIADMPGHVCAVIDGVVRDKHDCTAWEDDDGWPARVQGVYLPLPADSFDRAFERIETPTDHGTVHIRYKLTDAELEWLCTAEPPVPPVELWSIPPYGGEDPVALDLPVLLLDILGYSAGEFVSIGHDGNGGFVTVVMALAGVGDYVAGLPDTANVYFGVNPTRGPARKDGGRGAAKDITRLAALWADLDVKPGGCPNIDVAQAIITDLSAILGTRPSAVTYSGGGLHPYPYWPISDDEDEIELAAARALLARWGRLVKAVAQ